MKVTKILIAMLASAFIVTACDPIEDEDLRDKYVTDAGTPITKEALQAAISITQPFPNQDGVVEGDQYIALKNSRPDIGGSWHIEWGGEGSKQSKTLVTDNATVIMESNADYSIYYMGISANQIIKTDPVVVTVTNVFDDWSTYFTGATDKSDKSAKPRRPGNSVKSAGVPSAIWGLMEAGNIPVQAILPNQILPGGPMSLPPKRETSPWYSNSTETR